jgi:hypothetical protein
VSIYGEMILASVGHHRNMCLDIEVLSRETKPAIYHLIVLITFKIQDQMRRRRAAARCAASTSPMAVLRTVRRGHGSRQDKAWQPRAERTEKRLVVVPSPAGVHVCSCELLHTVTPVLKTRHRSTGIGVAYPSRWS